MSGLMSDSSEPDQVLLRDEIWQPGSASVAVLMISLNEAHNLEAVIQNLKGWAQEVFLVDSYSSDDTVNIALKNGIHVVQRPFQGFGDQWNFALRELPITAPWTMKLDPDERLTEELKREIESAIAVGDVNGVSFDRRLWFMTRPLPVKHSLVRAWRTGTCRFTDVSVNEHPVVAGVIKHVAGDLEHHDSPDLEHWLEKQNKYTTAEAVATYGCKQLADAPRLFGTGLQRRTWIKKHYMKFPLRYGVMFLYHFLVLGAWRAGWVGYAWSRLRCDVYRLREYKLREIRITGRLPLKRPNGPGKPDPRVPQY
jgi:glycosyltransferase involved in cell wall biosynthesis